MRTKFSLFENASDASVIDTLVVGDYFYYNIDVGETYKNIDDISYILKVIDITHYPYSDNYDLQLEPILYKFDTGWDFVSNNKYLISSTMFPNFATDVMTIKNYSRLLTYLPIKDQEEIEQLLTARKYNL